MIQAFADETACDPFCERNTRYGWRLPRQSWRIAQRKPKALDVAARLEDLRIPSANGLKQWKGVRPKRHSVRINDQ